MATTQEIFEKKIPEKLQKNAEKIASNTAIYEFNITGEGGGVWTLDLSGADKKVVAGSGGNAKCTVTVAATDFSDIIEGKLNPQMAFMTGKLKVAGDMGLALKLGAILG
ncbi:MAG TPA: sterol-binding protein [Deltaproteobacteria bacterium]|nr:sterol-binding protein [Deltaproteobacteria bacterium]